MIQTSSSNVFSIDAGTYDQDTFLKIKLEMYGTVLFTNVMPVSKLLLIWLPWISGCEAAVIHTPHPAFPEKEVTFCCIGMVLILAKFQYYHITNFKEISLKSNL